MDIIYNSFIVIVIVNDKYIFIFTNLFLKIT